MASTPQTETPRDKRPPKPRRSIWLRIALWFVGLIAAMAVCGALLAGYILVVMTPQLPSLDTIVDYRPKIPLRIYTADEIQIGEFGEERRNLVRFADIPDVMKKAVLAIEDDRFYQHGGVDFIGIFRAGVANFTRGGSSQGASTITMQVARNFFLSSEKTYTRKIYEALLAYKIESRLTKDQILELYMNQIYLGERAYGFASAARVYFGKDLKDITLAEAAMLAGLPKAPSAYNPIVNYKRARVRQEYILKRMYDLGYASKAEYDQAMAQELVVRGLGSEFSVHAGYVAEMVRQLLYAQFKDEIYTRGFNVYTTINSADQEAAYEALRAGVMAYELRHGYRGPEANIDLPDGKDEREQLIDDTLVEHPDSGDMVAAVVLAASPQQVKAVLLNGDDVTVTGDGLRFAAAGLSAKAQPKQRIRPGSVIRVTKDAKDNWRIVQMPDIEAAFVSLDPQNGAIRSLVGGFDFNRNKFNHVTQAWRQPGSSFKPFIYSAALEKGFAPATIINDGPLYFSAAQTGGQPWEPKNYGGGFDGPEPMRVALMRSRNLVSIRILQSITPAYAQKFIGRFGFEADKHPAYLPMALGAGMVTPLQMASGFAVFANGGFRVNPFIVARITDSKGNVIMEEKPVAAGDESIRAIPARNAFIMNSMLHDVATRGTAAKTNVLKRSDLAGKTGTTNDSHDAWFAGYQSQLVGVAWIGFDQPRNLGDRETGGGLALPIWIDYMSKALRGVPEAPRAMPPGVIQANGDYYYDDYPPGRAVSTLGLSAETAPDGSAAPGPSTGALPGQMPAQPGAMPAPAPAPVDRQERQRILDMFNSKP
ncbi:penicillin-binding protein 1A [Pandoraea sputorum]|uniref:Penicillin-binding protein 1A n=1 Tax=Pandoraea sputorum TaxID=93222 RepID=A0A239SWB5_9BURK|nr:penicillin-binding protein 1A [Pandoraea sputorum]AJC15210.1 penicillin-binding protein [Pandoraea sputorum]SNU89805.1 Penicillin-binding protein 1A [Pandoraea sputorum]VVE20859.1 penicillin-binding protein [Pandoraea sputorum]